MDKKSYDTQLVRLTQSLVNIETENRPPDGHEKEGQEYVKRYLLGLGMEVTELSPPEVPGFEQNEAFLHDRNYEGRSNVIGIWKGSGGGRSLLLTGHMDVAPKEPMNWTVCEPYESVVKEGRIYGRGSADMKAGLACALTALRELRESGFVPKGDILFESVVDEECAGASGTLASRMMGHNADYGIILEPTGLAICPACVGSLLFRLTVKGIAGMPYTGEEISNTVYDMNDLITVLREYDRERMKILEKPELWKETPQDPQLVVTKLKAGDITPGGQLSAPIDAWIEIVIQTYPNETEREATDYFLDYINSHYKKPEILEIRQVYHYCKAAQSEDSPALPLLAEKAARYTGKAKVCGAMFSCDLFALKEYGNMPAAVFGPAGEKLHGPDEWVDIESMTIVKNTLIDFIKEWCG